MLGSADILLFDGFRLDRGGLHRLDRDGNATPAPLGSRALDLLRLLVERHGELISKDEIMQAVWPQTVVEENNLTVQISALRRILDRDRVDGGCIQTVPGRGYRFVAPVTRGPPTVRSIASATGNIGGSPLSESAPRCRGGEGHARNYSATSERALLRLDKPSLAVLPFDNVTGDTAQEPLADGIADDIITALARYRSLFVTARTSCFAYKRRTVDVKRVGSELGVRYLVEGSLHSTDKRVRVSAQLVEAEAGDIIWAQQYDRGLGDIFALQDEITQAVTTAIVPAIAGAERLRAMRKPPAELDAWGAYQYGLWHLGKFSIEDAALAERYFKRAIELDETFAGGYSGLAWAQLNAANSFNPQPLSIMQELAEPLAYRAISLDTANADAYACLATVLHNRGDRQGALTQVQRALALTPNLADAYGTLGAILTMSSLPKNGLMVLQTSIRLDPRSPKLALRLHQITINLYLSREYQAAVEAAKRGINSCPDFPLTYQWLAAALGQLGRIEEGKQALAKAIAAAPESFDIDVRGRVSRMPPDYHAHMIEGLRRSGWQD
jgi:adenylate cyclase